MKCEQEFTVSEIIHAKLEWQNCSPCINSKSLLMTVLRKRQCMRRNLGYCPTMYMIFDAMIALLSFPLFCSQRPSKSFITITKNLFSSSSGMAPLMDPTAQHKVLRFLHDHSLPLTCREKNLLYPGLSGKVYSYKEATQPAPCQSSTPNCLMSTWQQLTQDSWHLP